MKIWERKTNYVLFIFPDYLALKLAPEISYARVTLSRFLRRWQHDYGNFQNRDWSYPDRAIRSAIFNHRRTIGHFF